MPKNTRLPAITGQLADPPRLVPSEDGKLSASLLSKLNSFLKDVITAINGRISFGDGSQASRSGNVDGQWIEFTTPSGANTEFRVPHGLGRRPIGYSVWRCNAHAMLKDSNIGGWDTQYFYLKCDTGSVTFLLLVV